MEKNSTKSNTKKPIDLKKLNPIYNIDVRPATTYQPSYFFGDKKMYGKGSIDFDVILNNGVKLQRNFVWKLEQKQDLIIGMLCGTKLPPFYVILYVDDTKGQTHRELKFKIIDGKQRLSTIRVLMT